MKGLNIIRFLVIASLAVSCKKDSTKHKRYSNWVFNGEEYRSNNVVVEKGDPKLYPTARTSLRCADPRYRFILTFGDSQLPTTGSWLVEYGTYFQGIAFYIDTFGYRVSSHNTNYITAGKNDGKAFYHMPPTWFHRWYNLDDSVLIEGTFSEP